MNKILTNLILICSVGFTLPPFANSQRPYGEVFAEDFGAKGCDPPALPTPPPQSPPPPWGWLPACPSGSLHRICGCLEDSGAALQNALNAVPTDGTLRFQHCRYLTNRTLVVNRPLTIEMTASDDRVTSCGIGVAYGTLGLHLTGFQTVQGHPVMGSSTVRGVYLHAYARPNDMTSPNREAHGILMEGTSHLAGVTVEDFEGDGIRIDADTSRGSNANQWRIDGGAAIHNQGVGLLVRGGDANAGVALRFSSVGNLEGNYHDNSALGNTYVACHSDFWTGSTGPKNSYESGWHNDNNHNRIEDTTNRNLYLNCYEEDGQIADLGANTIWIGGQGMAVVRGKGSVLKTHNMGFWAHHFLAATPKPLPPPPGQLPPDQQSWTEGEPDPVARVGNGPSSEDSNGNPVLDTSLGQFWLPTQPGIRQDKKPTLFVYPSTDRTGNIDVAYTPSAGQYAAALSLSTAGAQDPPIRPAIEAPGGGARLGRVWVFAAGQNPGIACTMGDLAINIHATNVWAWQCDGPSHWRELYVSPTPRP